MEFRRWGSLTPQKHKFIDGYFHSPPVEYGFYAFPLGIIERGLLGGYGTIHNGRCRYVRDAEDNRIMMTYSEFDSLFYALEFSEDGKITKTPVGLECMAGYEYDDFALSSGGGSIVFRDSDRFNFWGVAKGEKFDASKKYPLVCKNKKPTKFEYNGNIWHHLELAYPSECYCPHDWEGKRKKYKHLVRPEDIIRKSGCWILTDMKTYKKAYIQAVHIYKYDGYMRQKRDNAGNAAMIEGRFGGVPNNQYDWDEFEVYIEKV